MNRKYLEYLWVAAAWLAVFALFPVKMSAQEIRIDGKNITQAKEQAASVAVMNEADAKVIAMPNPVAAYPIDEGYPMISWETLASYKYDAPTIDEQRGKKIRVQKKKHTIPAFIKDLNGTKAAVTGFMLPVDTDDSGVYTTAFIIVRNQMACCFGVTPKLNEWIRVTMKKGRKTKILMDVPTTVYGTLETGEKYDDIMGYSLYRMTAVKTKTGSL